jgi:hypothetical protein
MAASISQPPPWQAGSVVVVVPIGWVGVDVSSVGIDVLACTSTVSDASANVFVYPSAT